MSLVTDPNATLRGELNQITQGSIASYFDQLDFGDILAALPTFLRNKVPAQASYVKTGYATIATPDKAKAATILTAYARTTGGTAGALTVAAYDGTSHPSASEISIAPSGDIVTLIASGPTLVDVVYQPEKYDLVELVLPVGSTGLVTLPSTLTYNATTNPNAGVVLLIEATGTVAAGTTTNLVITAPAASNSTTNSACLNLAKTAILVNGYSGANTDAWVSIRVKLGVIAGIDVSALLAAAPTF